jgi:hypothetical protein
VRRALPRLANASLASALTAAGLALAPFFAVAVFGPARLGPVSTVAAAIAGLLFAATGVMGLAMKAPDPDDLARSNRRGRIGLACLAGAVVFVAVAVLTRV